MPFLTIFGATPAAPPLKQNPRYIYVDGAAEFNPKRTREVVVLSVSYVGLLAAGETIKSAAWEISDAAMIKGHPTVDGSTVMQMIRGGAPGGVYNPICVAVTSMGQTLVLPRTGLGAIRIVE